MALSNIDGAATRRRLHEIAAETRRAFEASARRTAELAKQAREAFEREEVLLKEAEQRAAEAAKAKKPKEPEEKAPKRPKPSTLALGGEEFQEAKTKPAAQPKPKPRAESDESDDLAERTWLR